MIPSKNQIAAWKRKAEKWDALDEKIGKFYESDSDVDEDQDDFEGGNLCDIGEIAAMAFGYL